MKTFDINVLLAGFSTEQKKLLNSILSPLAINLHNCDDEITTALMSKIHVILIGTENIEEELSTLPFVSDDDLDAVDNFDADFDIGSEEAGEEQQTNLEVPLDTYIEKLNQTSPYGLVYLLAPAEYMLSLTPVQQNQYRDFIIFPVNDVFLKKRLLRIVSDLQEKFVQLVKKRRLKNRLSESDHESLQLKGNLSQSFKMIKESNNHLIRLLSNQVFARMGQRASGRNQQLNLLLIEIAKGSGLSEDEIHDLTNAWHLRNIGKMGFTDKVLNTPYIQLSIDEQRKYNLHPTLSHAAMMIVRPLDKAAKIVLQHKEYIDGSGYPNGISGIEISKSAQVLTVMNDYTELVAGRYSDRAFSTVEALAYLNNYATEKYNDEIVNLLVKILPKLSKEGKGMHDLRINSGDLKVGMQLTRDLISDEGILLLSEGLAMDKESIVRIQEMELNLSEQFKIFIKQR
jgi:response regulator RpfG family c-di-GMP phosphodiesterase